MRKKNRGQSMVEFALVLPLILLILASAVDFFRVDWVTSTVAEAARQGSRQIAANAPKADNPFGPSTGTCSGQVLETAMTGTGCLTNAQVQTTIGNVMGGFSSAITTIDAKAVNCPLPAAGETEVCIWPSQAAVAGSYANCGAARTALGRDPQPGELGGRLAEWTNPKYKGCFQVSVTVLYHYSTIVPFAGNLTSSLTRITASTTMVAEY